MKVAWKRMAPGERRLFVRKGEFQALTDRVDTAFLP
jgi:hypothetical protein